MIKIEGLQYFGFEGALRGMRNPLDSWNNADSEYDMNGRLTRLGTNDESLMKRLTKAGTSHRKFLRMIHVQVDVTAPLYWWKEFDTYKIATTSNSCSTMHKIHEYEFTADMFSTEHLDQVGMNVLDSIINYLNFYRKKFLDSNKKDKNAWYKMIQMLPTSYMQKRTLDLNYENLLSMIRDRHTHKLDEWCDFCEELYRYLPYFEMLFVAAYSYGIAFKAKRINVGPLKRYRVSYLRDGMMEYTTVALYHNDNFSTCEQVIAALRTKLGQLSSANVMGYEEISGSTDLEPCNAGGDIKDENKYPSNMYPDITYKISDKIINNTKSLINE